MREIKRLILKAAVEAIVFIAEIMVVVATKVYKMVDDFIKEGD